MINLNKRIFITGANGFIGANLLKSLREKGASDLHILLRPDSDIWRIRDLLDSVQVHHFSLENREECLLHMSKLRPAIVYHLAARGAAVGRAPFTLDELLSTNFVGTANLLDSSIAAGSCELFVNTGSSSEYGAKDHPMNEGDVLEPNNLYGISKAGASQYVSWMSRSKAFPAVTYRLFSVYGPLEDEKRLIPTLVRSYIEGTPPSLSSPHSVRDYISVDDVIEYCLQADRAIRTPGDIINIGTGVQHSIAEVVEILNDIQNTSLKPLYGEQKMNQFEPKTWVADVEKMKNIFGLTPRTLAVGLKNFILYKQKL